VVLSEDCGILILWLMLISINWKNNLVIFKRRGLILTDLNQETCIRTMQ